MKTYEVRAEWKDGYRHQDKIMGTRSKFFRTRKQAMEEAELTAFSCGGLERCLVLHNGEILATVTPNADMPASPLVEVAQ